MTQHTDRLDAHARELARETGLDYPRIRKVIGRSARDKTGRIVPEDADIDPEANGVYIWPDLREGMQFLRPERTLQLFEEIGADGLATLLLIVNRWSRSGPPLYRFSELAHLLPALRAYLTRNRADAVRIGHAGEFFRESPWLWEKLSGLYAIRSPMHAEFVPEPRGRVRVHYSWTKEPWTCVIDASGRPSLVPAGRGAADSRPIEPCDYADAPILDGLNSDEALRVEKLRPQVLDFKIDVLRLLETATSDQSPEEVIEPFSDRLRASFAAEDAKFLLHVDHLFSQRIMKDAEENVEALIGDAGGLADTIRLVLLFAGRRRSRAVDDLRDALENDRLISLQPFSDPRPVFESYFEVVDKPFRANVDRAIAEFWHACKEEAPFFEDALARVQQMLPAEMVSKWTVWGQDAADLSALVREYVRWQVVQKASTGRYGALDSTTAIRRRVGPTPGGEGQGNLFKRAPYGTWTLRFAGKSISTDKDLKGLRVIAHLLRNADVDCWAMDLATISTGARPSTSAARLNKMDEVALAAEGLVLTGLGDSGIILDSKAMSEARKRYRDNNNELDDAERDGDQARIQTLRMEREALLAHISQAAGLNGRPRIAGDPLERARKSVSKQITGALEFVKDRHPELHAHLHARLDYSLYVWVYRSVAGVTWDT